MENYLSTISFKSPRGEWVKTRLTLWPLLVFILVDTGIIPGAVSPSISLLWQFDPIPTAGISHQSSRKTHSHRFWPWWDLLDDRQSKWVDIDIQWTPEVDVWCVWNLSRYCRLFYPSIVSCERHVVHPPIYLSVHPAILTQGTDWFEVMAWHMAYWCILTSSWND